MASLVLYDGVCGFCQATNQFILARDTADHFRFASLQNPLAQGLLAKHGVAAVDLTTVYVVPDHGGPNERLLSRGDAVAFVLQQLPGVWSPLGKLLALMPSGLVDWGYGLVSRNRYKLMGKHESCPIPPPEQRAKFLDVGA